MPTPRPESRLINPTDARVFRITHVDNLAWILGQGIHCRSSGVSDPGFVSIGLQELIDKRANHLVPLAPFGVLADYVPFYFTPWSMMLYNIKTGRNGVPRRSNEEIAIIGTRYSILTQHCPNVLFTDGHAYMVQTCYFDNPGNLDKIDWPLLQNRDFRKDESDIDKSRRYQAEVLAHRFVPPTAIAAIACHNDIRAQQVEQLVAARGLSIRVVVEPAWYF